MKNYTHERKIIVVLVLDMSFAVTVLRSELKTKVFSVCFDRKKIAYTFSNQIYLKMKLSHFPLEYLKWGSKFTTY